MKDITGAVNVTLIVLIVVLMVSASTVVVMIYQGGTAEESSGSDIVAEGMTIEVEYTGKLLDGRIFDTSNYTIASNDALYPKSLSFTLNSESDYDPLELTVGDGDTITGFEDAVIGMMVGETKTVTISSDEAYGDLDEDLLTTFDLVDTVELTHNYTAAEYLAYFGINPVSGMTVSDPVYGWPATVFDYNENADRVIVVNQPSVNTLYHIYGEEADDQGWDILVSNVDSTSNAITIEHQLTDGDSGYIEGVDADDETFSIIDIDTEAGTAVMNYNDEVVGKTLVFTITIVSISE
ncbi:MAG: FKBP-type peptidyl-prolyl cis-trans isomerase [Methanomassiliicoccales archaeon]|nr:FKBP-type peptidyl-prolyl cis-trans isomerase [Methanomassiliicoccales archaeon]